MLAGVLDNNDELVVFSQVCSESEITIFEKDFDLGMYTDEQCKTRFQFVKFVLWAGYPFEISSLKWNSDTNGRGTLYNVKALCLWKPDFVNCLSIWMGSYFQNQIYEWLLVLKTQLYEWGYFRTSGPHICTKMPPPHVNPMSRLMTKPTKWHVRPAKTQIRVFAVRSIGS